jgi:hypothetical protein
MYLLDLKGMTNSHSPQPEDKGEVVLNPKFGNFSLIQESGAYDIVIIDQKNTNEDSG